MYSLLYRLEYLRREWPYLTRRCHSHESRVSIEPRFHESHQRTNPKNRDVYYFEAFQEMIFRINSFIKVSRRKTFKEPSHV
jgi:hypothetical protein